MDEATKKKWLEQVGPVKCSAEAFFTPEQQAKAADTIARDKATMQALREYDARQPPAHYDMPIQPYEFIAKNNLNFAEGSAIKYICRHRRKGGKDDLLKAVDFINKLIATEYPDE